MVGADHGKDLAQDATQPVGAGDGSDDTLAANARPGKASRATLRSERYEREGELGKGGMGVVSLHRDHRIGRSIAVKEMGPLVAGDAHARARFVREAKVQGQLEHPAIVPVYDLAEDENGVPYFTMKSVRGVTLAQIIRTLAAGDAEAAKKYGRHRLLTAFASICLAVDFAHERGVIHRDLKPANIMLGDYGEVYVLDWGLAKLKDAADPAPAPVAKREPPGTEVVTEAGAVLGTAGYIAPEQLVAAGAASPQSDVYALGAILFELLALEPLHGGDSVASRVASTLSDDIDARPSARNPDRAAAPELEAICVRATARDPAARFTSARALHEAIERYLEGERDSELRAAKSAEHTAAAQAAAKRVHAGEGDTFEARRQAMRAIGAALALDPENTEAVELMVELLERPPDRAPPEVEKEIDQGFRARAQWVGKVGVATYFGVCGLVPVLWWMGIRNWIVVAAVFGLLAVCGIFSAVAAKSAYPPARFIVGSMLLSCLAFAIGSRFVGALVLIPAAVAVNATSYAVFLERRYRWLIALASCLALGAPIGLEALGVLSPSYAFTADGVLALPNALWLPPAATTLMVLGSSLASILLGVFIVGHIGDTLAAAERRIYLYAWHLRELAPSARNHTGPIAGRSGDAKGGEDLARDGGG